MQTVIVKKKMGTDWPAVGEPMEVKDTDVALLVAADYVTLPDPSDDD